MMARISKFTAVIALSIANGQTSDAGVTQENFAPFVCKVDQNRAHAAHAAQFRPVNYWLDYLSQPTPPKLNYSTFMNGLSYDLLENIGKDLRTIGESFLAKAQLDSIEIRKEFINMISSSENAPE